MKNNFATQLKGFLKGILPDKANEIDNFQIQEVEEVEKSLPKGNTPTGVEDILAENVQLKKKLAANEVEMEQLRVSVGKFEQEKTERETALKTQSEKQKADEIEAILKKAIEDKKIPAKNEELQAKFKAILTADFENGKTILDTIPAIAGDKKEEGKSTGSNAPSGNLDLRKLAESAYASSSQN